MPKRKSLLIASFFIVLTIIAIFLTAQLPLAQKELRDLPLVIVNEDEGAIGEAFVQQLKEQMEGEEASLFQFEEVATIDEMKKAFRQTQAYGGLVIPSDYSALQQQGASPSLVAWVNEGANQQAAMIVRQAFESVEEMMQLQHQEVVQSKLQATDQPLPPSVVEQMIVAPSFEWKTAYETKGLESVPLSLFQPIWLASLIAAVLLFFVGKQTNSTTKKEEGQLRLLQLLFALLLGGVIGYSTTLLSEWILGYEYSSFHPLAIFLSIASIAFITLIVMTISWIGIGGILIFVLLLFFGLPVIQLPPEMLPSFYQEWVLPWLPMKFLIDGVKEILFFGQSWWNDMTKVFVGMISVSSLLLVGKIFTVSSTQQNKK